MVLPSTRSFLNGLIRFPLARYGHRIYGRSPETADNFQKRLEKLNARFNPVDESITFKVNIGFKLPKLPKSQELHHGLTKIRNNEEFERLARHNQLKISLEEVTEEWKKTLGPLHIQMIADHYGIFNDLFGDAYFTPCLPIDISFKGSDGLEYPVHRGNVVKPFEATQAPEVEYEARSNTLWTLVLTNPDGHFTQKDQEYVHWFVGNIPGNNVKKGQVIWDYMQPFPPKGTGFHRYVFVLYKQEEKIDYSKLKQKTPCLLLCKRTFKTLDFYREHQDVLTPAGLAFFQSDWDKSLTDFFHNVLDMREPIFEYDFPEPYLAKQRWFPLRKPFDVYLDKYRDPKQIAKEFLLKKLKNRHPFQKPPAPLRYPHAQPFIGYVPNWLRTRIKKERLGWGGISYY